MPKPTELRTQTGLAILSYLPALAALRIEVFRDWPYIYKGDAGYEENYLRIYTQSPRAAVVCAFDGDQVIGAATCLPLTGETENLIQPFAKAGLAIDKIFYFGESVLRKSYRGQGIGVKFFEAREAHARSFGTYKTAAFCAVQRSDTHPLKPASFIPLDAFWAKRGYIRQPKLECKISWLDQDETQETEKTLTFWTKTL